MFYMSIFIRNRKKKRTNPLTPKMTYDAESERRNPWAMPGLLYDWATQPIIKGTRVVLEIEIQEAQENALINVQSTYGGVLLHGGYPEP